jgi:large subunit ribosomal protein L35
MPKMKTHKGLKKRVKVTATGKLKRHHSGASHLMTSKNAKRRRTLRGTAIMSHAMAPKLRRLLGE